MSFCCGPNDRVMLKNCFNVSTYSALTPSSQSSDPDVYSEYTSLMLLSPTVRATPSSSVSVTSTIISTVVPAVVGTALLCLMVAAVFGSILALVLCKTKRKQFPVTNNSDQMSQQRYRITRMLFP